ncbi:MAG: ISL3 family transposase [Prevotella sp.]|nr:ISL3 family transposase [Prevotella sp.]
MTKANARKGKKKNSNRQGNARKFAPIALILASLFSSVSNYDVLEFVSDDNMIHAILRSRTEYGICPHCGMPSCAHHGFTKKEVHCLPSGSGSVSLTLLQHRYLCSNEGCIHSTFTETSEDVTRYGRRTNACDMVICSHVMDLSSRAASRLLSEMGVSVSANTCTACLHRMFGGREPDRSAIEVVGIDDFAVLKGHRYYTVIVDQDTHNPLEFVPSRDAEEVARRLLLYPNLRYVTRDRGRCYIAAIRELNRLIARQNGETGGHRPFVEDIADKFHIMENLSAAVFPELAKEYEDFVQKAAGQRADSWHPGGDDSWMLDAIYGYATYLADKRSLDRQAEWKRVMKMYVRQGSSIPEIATETGMKSQKVKRYIESDYESLMGEEQRYIFRNAVTISREMRWAGAFAAEKLAMRLPEGKEHAGLLKALEQYMIRKLDGMRRKHLRRCSSAEYVKEQQRMLWRALFRSDFEVKSEALADFLQKEHVQTARYLCQTFRDMLAGENEYELYRWIDTACMLGSKSVRTFAEGIRNDYAAIKRAIGHQYNNGLLEGTVCKIKAIKRIMYGRASFKLLEIKCTKSVVGNG